MWAPPLAKERCPDVDTSGRRVYYLILKSDFSELNSPTLPQQAYTSLNKDESLQNYPLCHESKSGRDPPY